MTYCYLSRESFATGRIDKIAEEEGRIKKTIRIDEELLNDILSWRKKINLSIKKNNKKPHSDEALEEIAQILLNRIIFIRTVEDRKLEAKSDETLKEILNQYDNNRYIIIKDKVNKLFEEYDKVYDSKLFTYNESDSSERHEAELVNIDNKTYYKILKETYDKNDIYQYKFNEIDANVLGSMYEKYIGNIQVFRRNQGIYYTPTYIVNYIVENTIGNAIKNKKPNHIENIKVLDMACGSGSFLLGAFDFLDECYKQKNKNYSQTELDVNKEDILRRLTNKTKVLRNNIFGVDLDRKAVEITELNLLLRIAETKHRLPDLKQNIKNGNSLIDDETVAKENAFEWRSKFKEILDNGGFDIIIGNPPYDVIYSNENPDEYEFYKSDKGYVSAESNPNLFALFIERAISLLKDGGILGFIIPNSIINNKYFCNLRKLILDKTIILQIYDLKKDVFKSANVDTCILILQKESDEKVRLKNKLTFYSGDSNSAQLKIKDKKKIYQKSFLKSNFYSFNVVVDDRFDSIKKKIERGSIPLGEIGEVYRGMVTRNNKECIFDTQKNSKYKPLLSGRDIGRYWLRFNNKYIYFDKSSAGGGCWDERVYLNEQKLLVQLIRNLKLPRRLIVAYDNQKYYTLQNLNNIIIDESLGYSTKYVLGIINSNLINYWFRKLFVDINIKRIYLKQIPIKKDKTKQNQIIKLVDRIISLNNELMETKDKTNRAIELKDEIQRIDKEINEQVYNIYGISDKKEIELIEETV